MTSGDPFGLCGQVLDGQFRVDRVIGEGGFSVVYKGHHVGLDEPIAVKCLKLPGALGSAVVESFVRRFRDESRIHYRLSQGNLYIARSIASGTTMAPVTGALVPYMVLEWLEGRSLAADFAMRRAQGLQGRSMQEAVKLLDSAVDALAYAHAKGVVHRDINPGNLFLVESRDGVKLKVLDFGVAKIVSDHALEMGPRAPTLGHIRIFSPAYASPEQFEDKIGKIGPWTDVYALSLVLLETLRDKSVNDGEHLGEFAMKALDEVNRPTPRALRVSVGDEVEALLARSVSMDPTERPQDAGEFWGMLKHAMRADAESGRPAHAHRPQSLPPRASAMPHATQVMEAYGAPAVEVVRPASAAPPSVTASTASRPPDASSRAEVSNAPRVRQNASTVRMMNAPAHPGDDAPPRTLRTGASALAATPTPAPAFANLGGEDASRPGVQTPPPVYPSSAPPPGGGGWMNPAMQGSPPLSEVARSTAPAAFSDTQVPKSRGPLIAIVIALLVVVVGGVLALVFFVLPRRGAPHPPAPTTSGPVSTAPGSAPTSETAPAPVASVDPSPSASATTTATATVRPTATATTTATASASTTPEDPHAFNTKAALGALQTIDGILASCKRQGGHTGTGHVTVTFGNDGAVTSAVVDQPPFAGTAEGACVESRFRTAHVPSFEGAPGTLGFTFHVPA